MGDLGNPHYNTAEDEPAEMRVIELNEDDYTTMLLALGIAAGAVASDKGPSNLSMKIIELGKRIMQAQSF
jgi:hypothetical protein